MRKKTRSIFVLFIIIFYSCKEDPPVANFSVTQNETGGNSISITFTDLSTNDADHWNWVFDGGSPSTSKEKNPTIIYENPGVFDVTMEASNDGGSDWVFKTEYMRIARFINNMPSNAEVSVGNRKKMLYTNSYVQFAMIDKNYNSCYIETYGKDANGKQTGLMIYWDVYVNFTQYSNYILGLSNELVFLNVTNISNTDFTHFMVNCLDPDFESLEELSIPNDGIKYGIGYYVANSGMEIRAYSPEGYLSSIEGEDFDIPRTNNQFVDLYFSGSVKTQCNLKLNAKVNNPEFEIIPVLETKESGKVKVILESGYK